MDQILEYIRYFAFIILGGGAGYFIRTFIDHRLAIDRIKEGIKITAFNKAAADFRCSFTKEIILIEESTINTDFIEIFNSSYNRHYNALIRFLPYLSERDRTEIKQAWDKHCYPKELDESDRTLSSAKFLHYDHHQGVGFESGKPRITEDHEVSFERAKKLVLTNLESLLSFAEFK